MNLPAFRLSISAAAVMALGIAASPAQAQTTAVTEPVGYYTVSAAGASDNIISLPMTKDAVFAGTVSPAVGTIGASGFKALAGAVSPGWTTSPNGQWKYVAGTQPQTYFVEFTSGHLKGLYYKITDNGADTLTLDTEGDDLRTHSVNGVSGALVAGDSFKIRPYWRLRDVFESAGTPIIDSRPDFDTPKDDVLIPNYTGIGQNKAANVIYYHLNSVADGVGWRSVGTEPADKGDSILRPNEAVVLRRRNAAPLTLTNLGSVQMIRSISFIAGGNGTFGNDTYISINRPAAVSLNESGLRNSNQNISIIKDSTDPDNPGDRLLAFSPGTGFNRAPNKIYYYLAGAGWRLFPDDSTDVGTQTLIPGAAYVVRKTPSSAGRDWVNDPNY